MLMRTDPFRELDRLTQQVLGTTARPAAMPMDAYRHGDSFYIHFDLPGINARVHRPDRRAERADRPRRTRPGQSRRRRDDRRRAALRHLHPAGLPRRDPRPRQDRRRLRRRRADPDHPGPRGGQAPQHPGHQQRQQASRHRLATGLRHPGMGRRPQAAHAPGTQASIRAAQRAQAGNAAPGLQITAARPALSAVPPGQ